MKYATIAAILLVFGCNTQSPNQQQTAEPPQSRPLSSSSGGGEQVEVTVYPDGRDPISRARLREIWPPLNTLSEDAVRRVAEAVNIIPSPCADCGLIPVAHCLEKGSAEACPVLNKLFERATRLASAGETQRVVKESINYPDVWFDGMGEGTPPKITLYRDESGPFSVKTTEAVRISATRLPWKSSAQTSQPLTSSKCAVAQRGSSTAIASEAHRAPPS